ncbi:IEC3 subunit of the Ino80 complex, chromatin re-modelling-domain-containing protein [Lipomyces kononenkoae]
MSEPHQMRSSFFPSALTSSTSSTSPPTQDRSPPAPPPPLGPPAATDRPAMSEMQIISPTSTRQSPFAAETVREIASPVPQGLPVVISGTGVARQPYKSFRKKYRKLRLRFDTVMRENEELEGKDFAAKRTIRRLNAENARLLDMLIDLSESTHINKQFQIGGLGVEVAPEERERQAKTLKWITDDGICMVSKNGHKIDVAEDQSEIKVESGNDNANITTEYGIDGTNLARPNTPQYLEDEILLLQDDYDSDF